MKNDGRLNFDIADMIVGAKATKPETTTEERFKVVNPTVIKVVGVGGGGGNTLNTMIERGVEGVEFIAVNTDVQALARNKAPTRIQIGDRITGGRGVGGKPENGRNAANEDKAKIEEALMGANLVFVCTGLGGGTGTGAAPVVAKVAREVGALVIAVVTRPFTFEGNVRQRNAETGILELTENVDARIVIPNDRLLHLVEEKTSLDEAFGLVDGVLYNGVKSISDLIVGVGRINVDFEDLKTIMAERGKALMGLGRATGDKRALKAAEMAIKSPLIEDNSIEGATGILLNFTGGKDLGLMEVVEAANLIRESASDQANIIFGVVTDPSLKDEVQVTVIATGFDRVVAESLYEAEPAELPEPEVIEAPAPQSYARANDDMTGRNGGMGGWFGTKRWSSRGGSALVNGAPNRYSVSEYSTSGNDKRRYRRINDDWMQD
jgi:cell division protein FtsZ